MKTGIVVGASEEAIFGIKTAKKMGIKVYAFDGNEKAEGLSFADEKRVLDIRDYHNIVEGLQGIKPDVVIPVPIGRYLISGAALNDFYGLKGISNKAAELCTDKYIFHKRLSERGLRKGKCILITQRTSIKDINFCDVEFPAIVKPRYGSGSRGVVLCNTEKEIKKYFSREEVVEEDYILESAFHGTEYGVDGAIIDGRLHLLLIREKINTGYPARQCIGYIAVTEENEFTKMVYEYLSNVARAIELNHTLFHADIMARNNELFVIEISGRPSGHRLHNIFTPMVTAVNMVEEYLKYSIGKTYSFDVKERKKMMIRFFDFSDCRMEALPSEKEVKELDYVRDYVCNIQCGQWLEKVVDGHSIMRRGYFIVEGISKDDLLKKSDFILNLFQYSS